MDPITIIVTALALGAAAGLKPTVAQAVKDGYAGLKALITRKYQKVSLSTLEANPGSQARREVVEEDLKGTGADQDMEVLGQAKALLEAVKAQAPEAAGVVGVDLSDVEAGALTLKRIVSAGTGVSVRKAKVAGNIEVTDVTAGATGKKKRPKQ
jgi:hypothetical protein